MYIDIRTCCIIIIIIFKCFMCRATLSYIALYKGYMDCVTYICLKLHRTCPENIFSFSLFTTAFLVLVHKLHIRIYIVHVFMCVGIPVNYKDVESIDPAYATNLQVCLPIKILHNYIIISTRMPSLKK